MKIKYFIWSFLLLSSTTLVGQSVETGLAIFYGDYLDGQSTALGEIYHREEMTTAHKSHPKGTLLKVTRLDNRKSVIVRVNDRGPYCDGCVVDISKAAADYIDLIKVGKTQVQVEVVGRSNHNPESPNRNKYLAEKAPAAYDNFQNRNLTTKGGANSSLADPYTIRQMPNSQQGFAIQLGSYTEPSNAERHIIDLQKRGVEFLYMQSQHSRSGTLLYRVLIGPFPNYSEAQRYAVDMRNQYNLEGVVSKLR